MSYIELGDIVNEECGKHGGGYGKQCKNCPLYMSFGNCYITEIFKIAEKIKEERI